MYAKIIDNKTIHIFDKSQFDIFAIRNCGQIFRDPPCEIIDEHDFIVIKSTGARDSAWLWNYFDLETDYNEIKRDLAQFEALREPMELGGGIRILRQPFIECVISFIISANNNIKRFTKIIEQIDFDNLQKYSEDDFKKMGCGYRSGYLVKSVKMLYALDASQLAQLDNIVLRRELMKLAGVGPKVADCIMLFAFHRLDVVPVDVHIGRVVNYMPSHKYAGVAQQYVFYYVQHLKKNLP